MLFFCHATLLCRGTIESFKHIGENRFFGISKSDSKSVFKSENLIFFLNSLRILKIEHFKEWALAHPIFTLVEWVFYAFFYCGTQLCRGINESLNEVGKNLCFGISVTFTLI